MANELGEILRTCRRNRGLTQAQVAEAIGVGGPFISKIEGGRDRASLAILVRFASFYKIDLAWLLLADGRCVHCGSRPEQNSIVLMGGGV